MKNADEVKQVMEEYGSSIYRLCFYMLQNSQDAQDALQETLIRFMERAPEFTSDEHEKAWLLKVANNICIDALRSRRKMKFLEGQDLERLEKQVAASGPGEDSGELIRMVFSLKEKYRSVIYLFYFEEYKIKEIASILKISEATVKTRLVRGRSLLRACLQEVPDEE